jgi:hypothetical protein
MAPGQTSCPTLVSHRTTIRLECYGILGPLLTTHGTLVPHLHRWLRTVSQQPDAPLFHVPADIKIRPTFQLLDGFYIVNQTQLQGDELPKNTSTIIHFPANRFPVSPQDPAWIPRKPSALLLFKGPNPLPEVSELQVRALADMLRCRLWLGAHGLLEIRVPAHCKSGCAGSVLKLTRTRGNRWKGYRRMCRWCCTVIYAQ